MKQYIVDAFAENIFEGNPAAVCVMDSWLDDKLMMLITKENNLSETAFAVKEEDSNYKLRWFTPGGEIDLCGHATLATAYVITEFYEQGLDTVKFDTLSGLLTVKRNGEMLSLDFPTYKLIPIDITNEMLEAIGSKPNEAYIGRDLLCVFEKEEDIYSLKPNMEKVRNLEGLLLHVTAKGKDYDCVSRSFAPKLNITEDPVCGSGHCHIIPFWSSILNKTHIVARQASERGGTLYCDIEGDRISMSGKAKLYATSEINI